MPDSGDLIGPYRFISQLGRGAMGEVWRARDERLDRYVALKVLPSDLVGDVERRARMIREARAAAAIRHASVVTLFDILTHEGNDVLVMELVEGRTLSEALRKDGPPTLEVALRWIEGVADALVAAHARGILHRDIKAANIMVTPDGIKVLDFGLAKLRDDGDSPISGIRLPPAVTSSQIALDETMASEPGARDASISETLAATPRQQPSQLEIEGYRTHAGQLLGTPLYMAPEQVEGVFPDERSEVFSVGVLAHEILAGKPPYTAAAMDTLFQQITNDPPPPLPDHVPNAVEQIITRALAKAPAERYPTMQTFRDAIAAQRQRLFAPPARRWPLVVAGVTVVAALAAGAYLWSRREPAAAPARPGDEYVKRALEEYDVFYNDKALSSLRAALAVAPQHPRALAYTILFGGAPDVDRMRAALAARTAHTGARSKDRALLEAALALAERGPEAARSALATAGATGDRELAFWTAELDYRAGNYTLARDEYQALLVEPSPTLRGRIYDHHAAVLLYLDEPAEALRIGTLYRDAFPGEADALGVYATTLAAAGHYDHAVAAAEEALRLSEGEDTLAGLAKVVTLAGDRVRGRALYQRSLERAGPTRRPLRRAALGLLVLVDGDREAARAIVAPCLAGGVDAEARERGACLFVAGIVDPDRAEAIAGQLDTLASSATPGQPAYGAPTTLAALVRARARFFAGACVIPPAPIADPAALASVAAAYAMPLDFYAAYHVPYVATWASCESGTGSCHGRSCERRAHPRTSGDACTESPLAARAARQLPRVRRPAQGASGPACVFCWISSVVSARL
ncbi:MAG: protein kinase [Kofleriaceae bacterium]